MSQYGAYGAARDGLTWKQILAFYFRGTKLKTMAPGATIRARISADSDGSLRVLPARGLTVHDGSGHSFKVPTGSRYRSWRIIRSGSGYKLSYRNRSGNNITVKTKLSTSTWKFSSTAKIVKLVLPGGSVRPYRGSLLLVKNGSSGRTVNRVKLDDYVRGVVPYEMPTSWAAHAVRAQAVAARSYGERLRAHSSYSGYDVCDTTACQVYGGVDAETARGNAAVRATARVIVTHGGKVALTQFASSNGGHTAKGDYPYLHAHADRYDGMVTSQKWTRKITTASIKRAWPSVGTVRKLKIASRDGGGAWGGRVTRIQIIGSKRTVTVGGTTFRHRFGLRSNLFTVTR
jgi:SpoIID/LytB domain protein